MPPYDATAVARLTGGGAIVLGKTQMGPLATTRATTPGGVVTTVNAWTPTDPGGRPGRVVHRHRTAVAGRHGGVRHRHPDRRVDHRAVERAEPHRSQADDGRVSLHGIIPLTYTRDHPGPLARDAKDAAIMLTAMAGEDPDDPRTQGLPEVPKLIDAATPDQPGRQAEAAVEDPDRGAARLHRRHLGDRAGAAGVPGEARAITGATIVDVPLPDEWELLTGSAFNNVRLPERTEPFLPYLRTDLRGFGVSVTGWLQGALLGGSEFLTGQRAKLLLMERVLDQLFASCDVVVQTGPVPFDILGLPEIAFPIGFTGAGLPIGTILGGLPYGEDRLLSVAAAYQAVTDWHLRRPADPPVSATDAERVETLKGRQSSGGAADPARGRLSANEVAEAMQ